MKKIYKMYNIDCANCAAKIEKRLNSDDKISSASVSFPVKKIFITSKEEISQEYLQGIIQSVEHGVTIKALSENEKKIPSTKKEKYTDGLQSSNESNIDECEFCEVSSLKDNNKEINNHFLNKKDIYISFLGLAIAISAFFISKNYFFIGLALYIISYLLLGYKVLIKAVVNISRGGFLDENFLMAIATIGAFGVQQFAEAVAVMLFYRIGETFEDYAVSKSRRSIMDAVDMRPEVVTLVNENGDQKIIPANEAKVGQHIIIKVGDRVPLDGKILEGNTYLDTSPITGENIPVIAKPGDEILSGSLNTSGVITIEIQKKLSDSMVTSILNSVEEASANKPKIEKFISKFSRRYTPIVVAIALLTAIVPSLITGEWSKWIYISLTFLVISCPCALVLSVPLAYFSGIGTASKNGVLFKGGISLEALTKVKTIVMDKTGTITKGDFKVQKINVYDSNFTETDILSIAGSLEKNSSHPIARSIMEDLRLKGIVTDNVLNIQEQFGQGIVGEIYHKHYILGNSALMEHNHISLKNAEKETGTTIYLANETHLKGSIVISDTIKDDAKDSIEAMNNAGFNTVMLTGDSSNSALEVQQLTGVKQVYSNLLPTDKLLKLQELRKDGPVMFIGDGINDAPVLANADCGAAMGSGADAAIEAADIVFMNSKMSSIMSTIGLSKRTNIIARENVIFAILIKISILGFGLFGFANMWWAVFADTGVAILCLLNSIRLLHYHMK